MYTDTGLHVLPVSAWVLSGFSDFPPQSKDMQLSLNDDSKLPVDVNVSLNVSVPMWPVIVWRSVRGVCALQIHELLLKFSGSLSAR